MFTHVVMFRLLDRADIPEAMARIRGMAGKIPGLLEVRVGSDRNRGPNAFDVVLITAHCNAQSLADYATHPAHQDVLSWLRPRWTDRAVVDTADLG